jgi:hypothetical protein
LGTGVGRGGSFHVEVIDLTTPELQWKKTVNGYMQTGDLYVIYQMVKEDWKAFFVSRQRFEQLKALEESM